MITPRRRTSTAALIAGGLGLAAASYVTWVVTAWYHGRAPAPRHDELDPLLEDLLPEYEVVERHQIRVAATPDVALAAAAEANIQESGARPRHLQSSRLPARCRTRRPCRPTEWAACRHAVLGVAHTRRDAWTRDCRRRGYPALAAPRRVPRSVTARISEFLRAWLHQDRVDSPRRSRRSWGIDSPHRDASSDDGSDSAKSVSLVPARFSPGIVLIRRVMLRRLKRDAERGGRVGAPLLARPE